MRQMLIYGLVDPRSGELRYVGVTVKSASARLRAHLRDAPRFRPRHVSHWLLGLASAGLQPETIEVERLAAGDDWRDAERFWIAYFRSLGCRLANHTEGGQGTHGYRFTAEQRAKLRAAHAGQQRSPETVARFQAAMAAKKAAGWIKPKPTPAAVAKGRQTKAANAAAGKQRKKRPTLSAEQREHQRQLKLGKRHTPEARAKMKAAQQRRRDRDPITDEFRARCRAAKRRAKALIEA